ncbi:hypothetical protein PHYC_03004 [Phycisphaerales bacterium]|nr:hypothetical protein PHYC_03004 [Phycisphaerales bacterium]
MPWWPKRSLVAASARWAGAALSVPLAAGLLLSFQWEAGFNHQIRFDSGGCDVGNEFDVLCIRSGSIIYFRPDFGGFGVTILPPELRVSRIRGWHRPSLWPTLHSTRAATSAQLPLWIPLFALAAPTVYSWIAHPRTRRRQNTCACGYDLIGLPRRAKCPECGARGSTDPS